MRIPARRARRWFAAVPWIGPRFLGVALLAHGAAFWLFQIFDPMTPRLTPSAPPVRLVGAATVEGREFLAWIDANAPVAARPAAIVDAPALVAVAYRPVFADAEPLPIDPVDRPDGSGGPMMPFASTSATPMEGRVPTTAAPRSRWMFGGTLSRRSEAAAVEVPDVPASREVLRPAVFRVAADARGELRFVFLEASSGSAEVDRAAGLVLARQKIGTGGTALEWGTATLHWGVDAHGGNR